MTVPNVISGSPITADWGNAVADAINGFEGVPSRGTRFGQAAIGTRAKYFMPGLTFASSLITGSLATSTLHFFPFVCEVPTSYVGVACGVQTGSNDVRLGIVTADEDWQAVEVVRDWGTLGTGSSGLKEFTHTADVLDIGRYHLVCKTGAGSPTLRAPGISSFAFARWDGSSLSPVERGSRVGSSPAFNAALADPPSQIDTIVSGTVPVFYPFLFIGGT
jgi:hypothetical protein